MFMLASMAAASVSGPVKIRNMSPSGALIEGAALPCIGEHVSLGRGELSAAGTIVWREGGRAGLRFDHYVEVSAWLPARSRQQQVDQTFHELKNGLTPTAPVSAAPAGTSPVGNAVLLDAAMALDALADALAEDARLIASLSTKLQALDIAAQLLRRCASSPDPVSGGDALGV